MFWLCFICVGFVLIFLAKNLIRNNFNQYLQGKFVIARTYTKTCRLWVYSTYDYLYSFNLQKKANSNHKPTYFFFYQPQDFWKNFNKKELNRFQEKDYKALKDMVISAVSSKLFELITVFQSRENNETNRIWAFHSASGIFR